MSTYKITGLKGGRPVTVGDTDTALVDGSLTIGNADTDNVVFNADVNSNIIPNTDAAFDLGSETKRWNNVAAVAFYGDGTNLTGVTVDAAGSSDQVQFNDGGDFNGAGQLYYKSGKVGIGDFSSTNPDSFLHIKGNTGGGQNSGQITISDFVSNSGGPSISIEKARGDAENPANVQNGDTLGSIYFQGYNSNSATPFENGASIQAFVDGTPSGADNDMGGLRFRTTKDGVGTDSTRMTIKSTGKIGVGNEDPESLFQIEGDLGGGGELCTFNLTDHGFYPSVFMRRTNGSKSSQTGVSNLNILGQIDFSGWNTAASGYNSGAKILAKVVGTRGGTSTDMPTNLEFHTASDGTVSTEKMTLTSAGRLGLGTSDPVYQLEVASGSLRVYHNSGALLALGLDNSTPPVNSLLGEVRYGSVDGSQASASISAYARTQWSGSNSDSYLSFLTTQTGSNTSSEMMRINNSKISMKTLLECESPLQTLAQIIAQDDVVISNASKSFSVQNTGTGTESSMSHDQVHTATVKANVLETNNAISPSTQAGVQIISYHAGSDTIKINSTGASDVNFAVYDENSQIPLYITDDGKNYIGTLQGGPEYSLWELNGTTNGVYMEGNDNDGPALVVANRSVNTDSDGIAILIGKGAVTDSLGGNTTDWPTTNNDFIQFYSKRKPQGQPSGNPSNNPEKIGTIQGNGNGGVTFVDSFTGFHATVINLTSDTMVGMIVESTGVIWHQASGDDISTALPKVQLTSSSNSKKVFGVLRNLQGFFSSYVSASPLSAGETQVDVNSIGEGKIWITNINGNIENGDYISSSDVSGYGQLQDDDILHSYTVAKCTENIDWNSITDTIEHNGVTYKRYLTACTYHCG